MNSLDGELGQLLGDWWTKPELQGLNRLPARTSISPVDGSTDTTFSLDGTWRFALASGPQGEPGPTVELPVPGCWTMQDLGLAGEDRPHYTNVVMPFDGDPPGVPSHNPTGIYERSFTVPADWNEKRIVLHVAGAESAAAIWCNDRFVGLMTDSRLPSEFDVTAHLRAGENDLRILVPRWTAHTWVEDQDHWHHGGLHRSVFLRATTSSAYLDDLAITTDFDPATGAGQTTIEARVGGAHAGCTVSVAIEGVGTKTEPVAVFDISSHMAQMSDTYTYPGPVAKVTIDAAQVRPWSHEDPHLSSATVTLTDASGTVLATESHAIGFTRVEIQGAELLLNGVAVLINGVNRHDHHAETGKTETTAELIADAEQIKAAGLNAIRTAHYPPSPALLDACDRLGLWVICEANLESHARWTEVSHDPRYQQVFIERVQRMVQTHRNHPSIMGWSLGNESGLGPAHDAAAAWVHHLDPSRFVQYEGGVRNPWLNDSSTVGKMPSTDVICPMYPTMDEVIRWATEGPLDAPMIMCEYSHAMGNSNGGLDRYWEAIYNHHGLQGGFVWDWKDQGLRTDDGGLGYGGHFGDKPNDGDFCCNGLVGAEGDPHPAIEELRYLTRPVVTGWDAAASELVVTNRRSFVTIDDLSAEVELASDGIVLWTDQVTAAGLAPGETVRLASTPPALDGLEPATDVHLFIRWSDETGRTVAWDQHQLRTVDGASPSTARPSFSARTAAEPIPQEITAGSWLITLDAGRTRIASIASVTSGQVLLTSGPELSLWRAPTDNDGVSVGPVAGEIGALRGWLGLGLGELAIDPDAIALELAAELPTAAAPGPILSRQVTWHGRDGFVAPHTQTISLTATGDLAFSEEVNLADTLTDLPRVGVGFTVPAELDQLTWFGPGPWETYSDRSHAPVGRFTQQVAEQYVHYAMPQHHGSHIAARWFVLGGGQEPAAARLQVHTDGLTFDVSRYSVAALTEATVPTELEPDDQNNHVHIDAALRGVGTGACGPDTTDLVAGGTYRFGWKLGLVANRP